VNLEMDMLAKYVERLLQSAEPPLQVSKNNRISRDFLAEHGFLG
jgi:hypothetical protein